MRVNLSIGCGGQAVCAAEMMQSFVVVVVE